MKLNGMKEEDVLRTVMRSLDDLVFVQDPEGRYLFYHGPARYGVTPDHMRGKTPMEVFHGQDSGRFLLERVKRVVSTGQGISEETRISWRGKDLWFLDQVNPLLDPEGGVMGVATVSRDITLLKETEEDLRRSEEDNRLLIESSPTAILVHEEGRFILCNPAAAELMRASCPEEMLGRHVMEFVPPEYRELVAGRYQILHQASRRLPPEEYKIILLDGSLIDVEMVSTSFSRHGKPRVMTVLKDISDRKRAEAELESFVYTAAHDLRTPLVSLFGYLHLLKRSLASVMDPEQKALFERIQVNADHFDRLLKDLLAFSKLGGEREARERVDITDLMGRVVMAHEEVCKACRAEIRVEEGVPPLWMHPTRAYQLFENLLTNSLKFHRSGIPVRMEVGVAKSPVPVQPPGHRWFFFRDNGRGIEGKDLPNVFRLFFRGHPKDSAGTGVGLAIVKKVVEDERGTIRVESEPGEGTTFFFSLPVETRQGPGQGPVRDSRSLSPA